MKVQLTLDRLTEGLQDALMTRNISVKDAARITGFSERSMQRFIAEGRLRSTKVGARRLLAYADVKAFAEGRTQP